MLVRTGVPPRRSFALGLLVVLVAGLVGGLAGIASSLVHDRAALAQPITENDLVSSDPADGATLGTSPEVLTFTFSVPLGPDDVFSSPVACGNEPQATGIPDVGTDRTVVTVSIPEALPRGACVASWSLRNGLGEPVASGLVSFSVQSSPATATDDGTDTTVAPAPISAPAADDAGAEGSTGGALWLGRVMSTVALMALLGAVVMVGMVWPEGPEYVITVRFLRSLWALALVGTVIFVVAFTAEATGEPFGSSVSPAAWADLLDAGWPGRAALLRLVATVLCVWIVARPERIIDPTTQLVAYALPALAVLAVGLSRTGGNIAVAGVALSVAHAFAAAVWFGGALLVARVVVAGPGDDDLVHAVRGFNRLSGPAILVTVGTGVLQMLRLVGGGLFSTSHGRVTLLKTVVVAAMVFVAVATRQQVAARLARTDQMSPNNSDRFRRAFTAEAGLGVVVLALSGWMLALPPAQIDDRPPYAIERQFVDANSGLDVTVFLDPSAVGLNGLRVEVHAPAEGISNLSVAFVPPEGSGARGIEQPIPLTGAGTAVLDRDEGLPFDAPGQWTMQLTGVTPDGTLTGATVTFPVTGESLVDTSPVGAPITTPTSGPGVTEAPPVISIEIIELEPAG